MEKMKHHVGPEEQRHPIKNCWHSDPVENFGSISLASQEKTSSIRSLPRNSGQDALLSQNASQILWSTGMLSEPIPNGFYSVIPEKRLKELFDTIPSLDELHALGGEGHNADVILVDFEKDKKLSMLKQLILALVKGLKSNPAALVKKIAGLVCDVYKRPNIESPGKTAADNSSLMLESQCVMLGHIKHGSCRPRAILFKVLADTVGFESRLVLGLPRDGVVESEDSHKHMSVIVVINSVELLVDLMRFPGQLIPRTTKALFMTHTSVAGESDSAENDSCDSPIEPNSPLYRYPERLNHDSVQGDMSPQFHRRLDASPNTPGPSLRKVMLRSNTSIDRKLSSSHSEPDITTAFWRCGRRKIIAEQPTANSSPEHPSFQRHRYSMLSGDRRAIGDYAEEAATSRSNDASTPESHRMRRRSKSITPEISDDIVRTVRAMNEVLKQNRHLKEQGDDRLLPSPSEAIKNASDCKKDVSKIPLAGHGNPQASQIALSLPSSPHEHMNQNFEIGRNSAHIADDMTISEWNRILDSYTFQNKALLPFEEWNIDFSELKVGTRVGIGFFGEVFRGVWNGTDVAIKVFLEQDLNSENMHDFCNEISILSRLRHPNVILFLGACTKPPQLSMVTEYMEMGSLYYLIHLTGQKKKLSWHRRLRMLRDICRGLMCIHRVKIAHRDLKSANCLVNKHWTVKICDFGLSRIMRESSIQETSSAGTPEWMAPELIRNEPFTEKCDIYSLGVIMWELYTLRRPWEGVPPDKVIYAVAREGSHLEIPEGPLGKLISDCWAEPHRRPTCEEILSRLLDCEYLMC